MSSTFLRSFLIILFSIYFFDLSAQNSKEDDLNFIQYLIGKEKYDDALTLTNSIPRNNINNELQDSLNYYKGWAFYNLQKLDSSSYYFNKVGIRSAYFNKSLFFNASNNIFLNKYSEAKKILNSMDLKDSILIELKNFELAGISLLERNISEFNINNGNLNHKYYQIENEYETLNNCYKNISEFKRKSRFLAGAMSAIIPGSGKIYAGKIGEGVSSFLSMAILSGITIECYNKAGLSNYKTILFGSLFSIFYIGNIYGSMISVNIYRNEFNATNNKKISLHIHIPLRTIFN